MGFKTTKPLSDPGDTALQRLQDLEAEMAIQNNLVHPDERMQQEQQFLDRVTDPSKRT